MVTLLFGPSAGLRAEWFLTQSVGDFLTSNWAKLVTAATERNAMEFLLNPYIIAVSVLFVIAAFARKNSKPLIVPIAAWGYGLAYHYSLGSTNVDVTNYMEQGTTKLVPLLTFIVGFFVVTAIILYLWIQDNN
ncbi:MAG: hypothetical protein IT350_16085 [Deltaproteobacteria bacterium]|nr:hypothetical protein [Deltaproteobacteria bacterium]